MDLAWHDQNGAGVPAERPRRRKARITENRCEVGIGRIDDETFLELLAIASAGS
jgi:hypothetical protein